MCSAAGAVLVGPYGGVFGSTCEKVPGPVGWVRVYVCVCVDGDWIGGVWDVVRARGFRGVGPIGCACGIWDLGFGIWVVRWGEMG